MTRRSLTKYIISLVIIVALITSFSAPAFAISSSDFIRAKSWIAAGITALNVALSPISYAGQNAVQQAVDPLGIVNTIQEQDYAYYMDRSTIKIYPDVVEIDGQLYSDIWLSYDAANKFRTEGLDFFTAYSIASNSNATYAEGLGYCENIPIFNVNNTPQSQLYPFTFGVVGDPNYYQFGNIILGAYNRQTSYYTQYAINQTPSGSYSNTGRAYDNFRIQRYSGNVYKGYVVNSNNSSIAASGPNLSLDSSPFEFDYVSESIPTEPLASDEGLYIRVPSSHSNTTYPERSYDIPDYVENNPDITNWTFDLDPTGGDYELNVDLNNGLGDLISAIIAAYLLDLISDPNVIIDYDIEPDEPTPPVPGTIANTPWATLERWLSDIKEAIIDGIQDIIDAIGAIEQWIIDAVHDLIDVIQDVLDTIADFLQDILDAIENIQEALQDILQDIADILSELLEDIESAPIRVFDKVLDVLRNIFLPIIAFIKLHFGIWHYVVEWVTAISSVFLKFFGYMSNTSYNMVLPIYAAISDGNHDVKTP